MTQQLHFMEMVTRMEVVPLDHAFMGTLLVQVELRQTVRQTQFMVGDIMMVVLRLILV